MLVFMAQRRWSNNMKPHLFNSNIASQNSYLFSKNGKACIVDPGFNGESLLIYLDAHKLDLTTVLLTHGHYDHIRDIRLLAKKYTFVIYIHEKEKDFLKDQRLNYASHFGGSFQLQQDQKVILVNHEEVLDFEGESIQVLHTPGHSIGSVSYLYGPYLFSGDTLLRHSVGRTDLATGSRSDLLNSINFLLTKLSRDTFVYPGHDGVSKISEEIASNPFQKTYQRNR